MSRVRQGFTLIELLLVISIIALLLALLLPALARSKDSARNLYCMTNVRGLVFAAGSYSEDNRSRYPMSRHWVEGHAWRDGGSGEGGIPGKSVEQSIQEGTLWPYVDDLNTYVCPIGKDQQEPMLEPGANLRRTYSQSWNAGESVPTDLWAAEQLQPDNVKRPSDLVLYCEQNVFAVAPYSGLPIGDGFMVGNGVDSFASYHFPKTVGDLTTGGSNVGLADGHVEIVSPNRPPIVLNTRGGSRDRSGGRSVSDCPYGGNVEITTMWCVDCVPVVR